MSEVNNYNQVFTVGMTKDEFIEQYQKLATDTKNQQNSVFLCDLDKQSIGVIYDTLHISKDEDILTDSDITALSESDGDATNISDEDMTNLYKKIQDTYKNATVTTKPIDSDSKELTPTESLGYLNVLKVLKNSIATNKKIQLQNEIFELINNNDNISKELKQEFNDITNKIKTAETELKSKQNDYDKAKDKVLRIKEDIARKQGQIEGTQDDAKKEQLQKEIDGLNSDLSNAEKSLPSISQEIDKLNSTIKKYKADLSDTTDKIEKFDTKTAQKIKEKQLELNNIDAQLISDLAELDTRIEATQTLQLQSVHQAGADSAHYEDISNGTVSDGTVGKNAAQALANATSQIGVREATGHNDGAQIAKYRNGVNNNAAWCASFVSWCYKGNDIFGYQASVSGIQMAAQKKNLYAEKGTYTPKPGDVMIQKNGASHTGIVESVDPDGTIHTIEGNTSNSVARRTYKPGSKGYNQISGWVKMSE